MADFQRLLDEAKAGDEAAFTQLFRVAQPLLLRYLRAVDASLAEDCAAETWIGVVTGLGRFEGDESAWRAYVLTIGRRRLIDAQRRRGHGELLYDDLGAVEHGVPTLDAALEVEERDGTARALALLQRLPAEQREAVFLRHVVGLDVAHTAALVRRTPGSVRVATHRGLRRLERLLADETGMDDGPGQTAPLDQ